MKQELTHRTDSSFLARRYRYLWTGELFAAVLFPVLLFWFAARDGAWRSWLGRGYAVAVVSVILLQGVVWWRWKLQLLRAGRRTMPLPVLAVYRRLRSLNWLLIALFPVVLLLRWVLIGRAPLATDTWLGLLFLGGAALEQINYYYVQLMYDNPYDWAELRRHRRLRRGSIAKALEAASRHT